MIDIGYVTGSPQQAKELVIGVDTVYIHTDIQKELDSEGNETGLYIYYEVQYTKDEYLDLLRQKNQELESKSNNAESNITDLQLALVDIYESTDKQITDVQIALTEIYESLSSSND